MRARRVAPGITLVLGLLVAPGIIGCQSNSAPASVATSSPPATSAASATATSSGTPASSGGVQNLSVSPEVRGELIAAFAARKNIPVDYVARSSPDSVYYSYDPATETYWAMADYEPANAAPEAVKVGFQDGGQVGLYKKAGNGQWQVTLGTEPAACAEVSFFPRTVLDVWSLPKEAC